MAAPPRDPKNARLRVSATLAGTYTSASMIRGYDHTAGTDSATTLGWFGGESVRAGDPRDSGTITAWFDREDTTGQTILKTSRDAGTTCFIQLCPEGHATGAKVDQMEIQVTEYTQSAAWDGEGVESNFSYTVVPGTRSVVTLA